VTDPRKNGKNLGGKIRKLVPEGDKTAQLVGARQKIEKKIPRNEHADVRGDRRKGNPGHKTKRRLSNFGEIKGQRVKASEKKQFYQRGAGGRKMRRIKLYWGEREHVRRGIDHECGGREIQGGEGPIKHRFGRGNFSEGRTKGKEGL